MARGGNNQAKIQIVGSDFGSITSHEDTNSPYFFHNADHPGLIIVAHHLTGSNCSTWSRSTVMPFTTKNKVGFIDGSIPRPKTEDLLFGAWNRCSSIVFSWILNYVVKEIADSLLYIPTAFEIWCDLKERFKQSNNPRVFQLKRQLGLLNQGSLDIRTCYTCLKTLLDELKEYQPVHVCQCGGIKSWMDHQQQDCVMQFLMRLNDSYAQIRAQILMMEPLTTVAKIFSLVVQDERQRLINHNTIIPQESLAGVDSSLSSI